MDSFLYSAIFFILALGLLIAVHEYGHYWVARKMDVKVLRFSIGFGKPLWQKTKGPDQTEYTLAMIPLGGYVKMLDEREGPVAEHELHRAFNRKSLGARTAVVAAGPLFNFIFAIFIYCVIFMLGITGMKPLVGTIVADSPFATAGLLPGDQILKVQNKDTPTLEAVRMELVSYVLGGQQVALTVSQEFQSPRIVNVDLSGIPVDAIQEDFLRMLGMTPASPHLDAVIGVLQEEGAAMRAGMRSGDKVLAVNGEAIADWLGWAEFVRARPEKELQVLIERDGVQLTLAVTPARIELADGEIGRVGASPLVPDNLFDEFEALQQYSFFEAVPASIVKTWDMSVLTLRMFGKMLVGEASLKNVSGPISIAQYAGQSAQIGFMSFLSFLAIVSVSLGVLNLLPVPVLDGGHLFFYLIEFLKGSPISEEAQIFGQKIGIVMIGGLMFLALFNDINRLIG